MQRKNGWSDTTVQIIISKSLSFGIEWINWTVLITKICNQLLPTALNLKKWNWKNHDNFILCKQKETIKHLIQCLDPIQNEWRMKYISKLQKKIRFYQY